MDPKTSRVSWSNHKKRLHLPFGYRFDPTGAELVKFYLIPKLWGEELPSDYIMDLDDVYQFEPHQFPFNQLKYVKENEAFFFTLDSRKDSAEESQIRTTPNGYWKVYQDGVPIHHSNEVIGFETKLFFHDVHGNKTDWKMIEYKCHPSQIPTNTSNVSIDILSRFMPLVALFISIGTCFF